MANSSRLWRERFGFLPVMRLMEAAARTARALGRTTGPLVGWLAVLGQGLAGTTVDRSAFTEDRQVTQGGQGKILANANVWSPDSRWIAYDVRRAGDRFDATRIERVNVDTGEVRLVYQAEEGANCGVATWHPSEEKLVFILGPRRPDENWSYGFSRRQGWLVDIDGAGKGCPLDAMNYAPPFVPGALRGGSHVHIFSGDGRRVSFTYDDEVLTRQSENPAAERNQRNVGVSILGWPVRVNTNHPRNHDGQAFSTLVTRTVDRPRPGSDEISRAAEEGWVGRQGYRRADGGWQPYALAFQGLVTTTNGETHLEVYVVDLPSDLSKGDASALAGSETRRPAPPVGAVQRRLTHTTERKYPGLQGPRHWLRSSPDGSRIAFLMKDDHGKVQLWTISPNGGSPQQVTANAWDVQSVFSWSPEGRHLAYGMDGSIFATEIATGKSFRLTKKERGAPHGSAVVFSPDGRRIGFLRAVAQAGASSGLQVFVADFKPD